MTDVPPVSKMNVDKSVTDDSSSILEYLDSEILEYLDSILEYLVTDDYDDSPEISERPN